MEITEGQQPVARVEEPMLSAADTVIAHGHDAGASGPATTRLRMRNRVMSIRIHQRWKFW